METIGIVIGALLAVAAAVSTIGGAWKYIKGEGKNRNSPVPAVNEAIDDTIRKYRKLKDNRFEKQGDKVGRTK